MLEVLLAVFLVGIVGTTIGGVCSLLLKRHNVSVGLLYGFASGIMITMVLSNLIIDAVKYSNTTFSICFLVVGYLIIYFVEMYVDKRKNKILALANMKSEKLASFVIILSIALHNFPEGMIIGASSTVNLSIDYILMIALHNIPEGMAIALPLLNRGVKPLKAIGICCLTGIPTVLGGIISYYIGGVSDILIGLCLSLASGCMLYVVFNELLVLAYSDKNYSFSIILGIILGLLIIFSL